MKIRSSVIGKAYQSSNPHGHSKPLFVWNIFKNCHFCCFYSGRKSLNIIGVLAGVGFLAKKILAPSAR